MRKIRLSERRVLLRIYCQVKDNGIWRISYNSQIYKSCDQIEIVIKTPRTRWLGHLYCLKETEIGRNATFTKLEGIIKARRPLIRWLDDVECDIEIIEFHRWRRKAEDERRIVEAINACNRL